MRANVGQTLSSVNLAILAIFSQLLTRAAPIGAATVRSCEKIAEIAGLTDESVCPTLPRKRLRFCGAGAFATQPIVSQFLRECLPSKVQNQAVPSVAG